MKTIINIFKKYHIELVLFLSIEIFLVSFVNIEKTKSDKLLSSLCFLGVILSSIVFFIFLKKYFIKLLLGLKTDGFLVKLSKRIKSALSPFAEKIRENRKKRLNKRGKLYVAGSSSYSFTFLENKKKRLKDNENQQNSKLSKWSKLDTDYLRARFLYFSFVLRKIREGERVRASFTPLEMKKYYAKTEEELEICDVYIRYRYASDDDIQNDSNILAQHIEKNAKTRLVKAKLVRKI